MNDRDIVRDMLKRNGLSQTWLILRLGQLGMVVDKSTMCCVLKGTRTGPKCQMILKKSLEVLQDYERKVPSSKLRSQFDANAIGEVSTFCYWLVDAFVNALRDPEKRAILEQSAPKVDEHR